MSNEYLTNDDSGYEKPSKSELKRRMTALQDIGKTLTQMPFEKVKRSPAGERLIEAIREYHRSKSHEGKRRQLQFIGKVMRDEDGQALSDWIQGETLEQKLEVTRMHAAEQWRDRMLAEPNLLAEFYQFFPQARELDLHNLIRNARAEKEKNKPPKSARELYQRLKSIVSENGANHTDGDTNSEPLDQDED